MRVVQRIAVAVTAVCMCLAAADLAYGGVFTAGASGAGDPFFPSAGNGGYDVLHYDLRLSYEPSSRQLIGAAVITATATQDVSSFDLDLRRFLTVSDVRVDGVSASFGQTGTEELVITPASPLPAGRVFTVEVHYAGGPRPITDPDGSLEGWLTTDDGAFVVGEPQGAPGWYPVDDTPRDKATFDISVSVPAGLTAVANGLLVSSSTTDGMTTWVWHEGEPMAPYLATATLGRFELTTYTLGSGLPVYIAVDSKLGHVRVLDELPDMVGFFSSVYGAYPFAAVGAIVDSTNAVDYSLETQTKPVFPSVPSEAVLAHELAHQWFGDAVTLAQWPDIWLHEGFATWSEWLWSEHTGGRSAADAFKTLYRSSPPDDLLWSPPPVALGTPELLFDGGAVYERGAMTLQALREKVGDFTFFRILRDWIAQHEYGNATTAQFVALAERVSGLNLQRFFRAWLYEPGKPTRW